MGTFWSWHSMGSAAGLLRPAALQSLPCPCSWFYMLCGLLVIHNDGRFFRFIRLCVIHYLWMVGKEVKVFANFFVLKGISINLLTAKKCKILFNRFHLQFIKNLIMWIYTSFMKCFFISTFLLHFLNYCEM